MSSAADVDLVKTLHDLAQRADTSYVIVAGTALENLLEHALLASMRYLSNAQYERIFRHYGPLSSFAAKIDLAHALKIIQDDLVNDFHAIRSIRNAFAHARKAVHMDSDELKPHFQRLTGFVSTSNRRDLFDARLQKCTDSLASHVDATIFIEALTG